ncbi:MAG: septation protein A [Gammaproteobacteria bacterium RIFCSPLOWO2_02_FULL_38_11]|nr:MAG: septation protein A [Gammaproteobacteria bacterium RIFCSPHIGHO2_02_FULL_38_33]OGT24508.1 MAG: septation protein A [Gammaproteobacteria bacterium RIFCSPHIGHO2_12_38_15]OGT68995.1 MAG: septation protein A [Gammaproteobacteria bacterium RIFCSPLOWO2_02_FULL_38_11]OGT75609.1 MAG: septation protein A [Gammaproteobacteria bacterium RIFCSPLOWO2_12_FULL_38_14]
MTLFYEFLPILLFFIAYKFAGIYCATGVAILSSLGQFTIHWFKHKKVDTLQLITLGCIVLFGGATLSFHNELFIKWKPTAINWIFALVFLFTHYFGKKPLVQYFMEKNIQLPLSLWKRLNLSWAFFFIFVGGLNLFVAYQFSTDIWVNFKLFGLMGLTLVFAILQSVFLAKHLHAIKKETSL